MIKKSILFLLLVGLSACGNDANNTLSHERAPQKGDKAPRLSFYLPGHGTLNVFYGMREEKPICEGFAPGEIFILMGAGDAIALFNSDCSLKWLRPIGGGPSGTILGYTDSTIKFIDEQIVYEVSRETGETLSTEDIGTITKSDSAIFGPWGKETALFVDGVAISETFTYPRDVTEYGSGLYAVADTFGQRVVVFNKKGEKLFQREFYYPNQATFLSADRLLVVEEHANRIVEWGLSTDEVSLLYGCDRHAIYTDLSSTPSEILDLENNSTELVREGLGVCAQEFGSETLYSPNGASLYEGGLLISDSDNHRVIGVNEAGVIELEISGLNHPTKAVVLK